MPLALGTDLEDPKTQALLALGLGLLGSRGGFAQSLSDAGQQAMGAYTQARQRQGAAEMQALQKQAAEMQMQQARAQMEQAQRQREMEAQILAAAQRRRMTPEQSAVSTLGGPTMAAAAAAPNARAGFDTEGYINDLWGIDPNRALATSQALRKEMPKLKSVEPMVSNGRVVNVAMFDDGTTRILPYGAKPDLAMVDAKNRAVFVDRNATPGGTSIKYGASPDALLKDAREGEANEINRDAQRRQIVTVPGMGVLSVDRGTQTAQPVLMAGNNTPVLDEASMAGQKRNMQLMAGIEVAENLLKKGPTQSYAGAGVDMAARLFGANFKSAELATRLEMVGGWLTSNVPRMEGPQSNIDVVNYQIMAGRVGDRTLPVAQRAAALSDLKRLLSSYEVVGDTLRKRQTGPSAATPSAAAPDYRPEDVEDALRQYLPRGR